MRIDPMPPATPQLQLETLFVLDGPRRMRETREPNPTPAPAFVFIRGATACAWAVRADIAEREARELDRLASAERPSTVWDQPLLHARRYQDILGGDRIKSGPAFEFPDPLPCAGGERVVHDEAALNRHFTGWIPGEIASGRGPVIGIYEDGHPVSICFCARRSSVAAEAGVETAAASRGRDYAPRVAIAWAAAVREQGLAPLYSTSWANQASLAVARKLQILPFATNFSVDG